MFATDPSRETKFSGTHVDDRGILIFLVQLTTSRIGNLTRLIHTLLYVMTIHTYCLYRSKSSRFTASCTHMLSLETIEADSVMYPYIALGTTVVLHTYMHTVVDVLTDRACCNCLAHGSGKGELHAEPLLLHV